MKKQIFYSAIVLCNMALCAGFAGCSSDDDNNGGGSISADSNAAGINTGKIAKKITLYHNGLVEAVSEYTSNGNKIITAKHTEYEYYGDDDDEVETYGFTYTFNYKKDEIIAYVHASNGGDMSYTFLLNSNGYPASVTATGKEIEYAYANNGDAERKVTVNITGNIFWQYNASNRATEVTSKSTRNYSAADLAWMQANGCDYDDASEFSQGTYAYDTNGNMLSYTQAELDASGNVLSRSTATYTYTSYENKNGFSISSVGDLSFVYMDFYIKGTPYLVDKITENGRVAASFAYEFDNEGYVTKVTVNEGSYISEYVFEY